MIVGDGHHTSGVEPREKWSMATVMSVEKMAKANMIVLIVIRVRRGGFFGADAGGGRLTFFASGLLAPSSTQIRAYV
jgi:hypothetical protein